MNKIGKFDSIRDLALSASLSKLAGYFSQQCISDTFPIQILEV
jgi:hypothetical protein